MRTLVQIAIGLLVAFYLGQYWRLKPTDTDDGLILDYIHQMSLGAWPHWDMVDAYGLFNWIFPVAFYELAGKTVWGVHLWVLILKLLSVWLCYRTVTRAGSWLYGALAALLLTVLLGLGWQPLQSPYAFLSVVPAVLAAWHALLSQPFSTPRRNALAAAAFTTLAIWIKLNTGIYLFAAGLFIYFFWMPAPGPLGVVPAVSGPFAFWLKRLRVAGVLAYAAVFSLYVRSRFEALYFVYLLGPLLLVLGWSLITTLRQPLSDAAARQHLSCFGVYLGTTLALSALLLFGYYGASGALDYARELAAIVTTIRYHYPFPPVGKPWFFLGFNENYWPQLPWLVTAFFCLWLWLGSRYGQQSFGDEWPWKRRQAGAVFLLSTLHGLVLYPRSDDIHLYQALLMAVPALFVLWSQLDVIIRLRMARAGQVFRPLSAALCALYASTLMIRPSFDVITLRPGDYENPRFEYLDYRPPFNPKIRSFAPHISDRDWDETVDLAGRYIDSVAEENEPILVLCDVRLLHFASRTTSVGGRDSFYFYLIAVQLLDRAGFDKIVPPTLIPDIMRNPPRIIVTRGDNESFVPQFPELRAFRDRYYTETKTIKYIHVYELRPGAREEIRKEAHAL